MSNLFGATMLSKREQGLGLVELMISITISLVIMAGVIQLFASSRQTSTTADAASRIQESMRYVMRRIGDDIYRAGNLGCLSFAAAGSPSFDASDPNNKPLADGSNVVEGQYIFNRLFVDTNLDGIAETTLQHQVMANAIVPPNQDANISDFESSFISGVDNDVAVNNILDGTDSLIVKYVDTSSSINVVDVNNDTQLTVSGDQTLNLTLGDVVFAGDCSKISVFNVGATAYSALPNTTTITMLSDGILSHEIESGLTTSLLLYAGDSGSHEYYIDQGVAARLAGNACDAANPLNCSLYRSSNGAARELVTGVSNLQVNYGYENNAVWQPTLAAGRLTIDRVQVTVTFNAQDATQAGGVMSRNYTRVFAVRNQL